MYSSLFAYFGNSFNYFICKNKKLTKEKEYSSAHFYLDLRGMFLNPVPQPDVRG